MRVLESPVPWRHVLARLVAPVAVAAALVLTGCGQVSGTALPRQAPALTGQDLSGAGVALADFRGQVVLVTAWSSWCAPCREEVPVLVRAQDDLAPHGFRVLGLNVKDQRAAAQRFAQAHGATYPSVVDEDGVLAVEWGLRALPETFVVDRDGRIVAQRFGAVDQAWIESVVVPVVHG